MSLLLLVSTMGMAATKHLCGDKLIAIQVFETALHDDCCDKLPMDCCDDEQISIAPLQLEIPLPTTLSLNPFTKIIHSPQYPHLNTIPNLSEASCHNSIKGVSLSCLPNIQAFLGCFLI